MVQILILAVLTLAAPILAGQVLHGVLGGRKRNAVVFEWISGQIILWAGFLFVCVPMILAERDFRDVVVLFSGYMGAVAIFGVALRLRGIGRRDASFQENKEKDPVAVFLWICVIALIMVQMFSALTLVYADGDDAYYVAVSVSTESSNRMYAHLVYTGGPAAEMDVRHCLAPMPVWVAYLARVCGIRTVIMAKTVLPVVLILMSHAVYFLLGQRLFSDSGRKHALFMLVIQILVIFGGYSIYSAQNFLLVRTSQGKAILANIVLPFLLLLFLMLAEQMEEGKKPDFRLWIMVGLSMICGCLCSTQGTLLTCIFLMAAGICMAACFRRWNIFVWTTGCCLVPVGMLALYFMLS